MDDRADVGVGEKIYNLVLAGFNIDFDFGEARDVGMRRAVARVIVAGRHHQTLPCQRCH